MLLVAIKTIRSSNLIRDLSDAAIEIVPVTTIVIILLAEIDFLNFSLIEIVSFHHCFNGDQNEYDSNDDVFDDQNDADRDNLFIAHRINYVDTNEIILGILNIVLIIIDILMRSILKKKRKRKIIKCNYHNHYLNRTNHDSDCLNEIVDRHHSHLFSLTPAILNE
ncbi:mitochondrial 28S ribosomal protein [Sarcoptes scabiei]|nr:mitochondrial 28S ribosomal protein [Sarcoptes scabiei]